VHVAFLLRRESEFVVVLLSLLLLPLWGRNSCLFTFIYIPNARSLGKQKELLPGESGAARISQSKQFGKQCNSKKPAMQLPVNYLHSVPQKYAEGNDFPPPRDNQNKPNNRNRRGTQIHK